MCPLCCLVVSAQSCKYFHALHKNEWKEENENKWIKAIISDLIDGNRQAYAKRHALTSFWRSLDLSWPMLCVQNCWKYVTGEDVLDYMQVCRWTSTDWVLAEWWLPAFDLWLYHWLYSQGSISKRGVIIFWLKGLRSWLNEILHTYYSEETVLGTKSLLSRW